jgi:hypothetical protein
MKFCLLGRNDQLLFIETNFCFAIPDKKEKYFNVIYHDEQLVSKNFEAKKIYCDEFFLSDKLFLEDQQ